MPDTYTGDTNKFGNAVGIPFSSFATDEPGMIDLAFAADDVTRMNDMFWLDGIRQDSADWADGDGAVRWTNGLNVAVRPFRGHVNGTIVYAPQITLAIDPESTSERVDSVVVRRDYVARTVDVLVLKGASGSLTPPALTYNAFGVVEYALANIRVANTMDALSQADITDKRAALVANMGIRPTPNDAGWYVGVGGNGALKLFDPALKLDTATYEADRLADAPFKIVAMAIVSATGTILRAKNITSATRTGAGAYMVYSSSITAKSFILANTLDGDGYFSNVRTPTAGSVKITTGNTGALIDRPFAVYVIVGF